MNKFIKMISLVMVLTGTANVHAALIETVEWNGTTYGLLSENTWLNSQAEAESYGDLVTINSSAEQEFLYSVWGLNGTSTDNNRFLWIGYNDYESEGNFVWASGELSTFTDWNVGEPNNLGNEDGVWLQSDNQGNLSWNDAQNSVSNVKGIVEFSSSTNSVSAPAMVSLFSLGLMLIGLSKRKNLKI